MAWILLCKGCSHPQKLGKSMTPKPSVSAVQTNLFQPELKSIINLHHPLVKLAGEFNWDAFERQLHPTYAPVMGATGINTRLMVSLHFLASSAESVGKLRFRKRYKIMIERDLQRRESAQPIGSTFRKVALEIQALYHSAVIELFGAKIVSD